MLASVLLLHYSGMEPQTPSYECKYKFHTNISSWSFLVRGSLVVFHMHGCPKLS
jgi:hypothetical protein